MKKIYTLTYILIITLSGLAQNSDGFKYQAVIRDASGNINANANVSMEFSIVQGSLEGSTVFRETHNVVSNSHGIINLVIGSQNPSSFAMVNWANGPYFIKISVDGVEFGTTQLMSVPYAMHAKTADVYSETDPKFSASPLSAVTQEDVIEWSNKIDSIVETDPLFSASPSASITNDLLNSWNNKPSSFTEKDSLFFAHPSSGIDAAMLNNWNTAYGWGNHADSGYLTSFMEEDPIFKAHHSFNLTKESTDKWEAAYIWLTTNHYGFLTATNSVAGGITAADTALWNGGAGGGSETDPVFGASIAHGISGSDTTYWNNKLSSEVDASTTNEIQTLSISNDTIYLTSGGSVKLPTSAGVSTLKDSDEDTKIQVEESADEDIIRFDIGGTERWVMNYTRLESKNTGGSIFIGEGAGYNDNLSANYNTFIGDSSGFSTTSGIRNIAIGKNALYSNSSGGNNTATGYNALYTNSTGNYNTANGYFALHLNSTGSQNTAYGRGAGFNSLGSGNVFLGHQSGYNETGDNKLYIDNSNTTTPLIYGDFANDSIQINGDLKVTGTLKIKGGSPASGRVLTSDANGLASWGSVVDASITNEIQTLSISNDTIYLTDGGSAKLPAEVDGSITNEIQTLSISNDTIYLSDGGIAKLPAAVDGSITNEIQTLSISNDTIYLTSGGSVKLPASGGSSELTDLTDVSSSTKTAGNLLVADGTNFASVTLGGDATLASGGSLTIGDNKIDGANIALGSDATGDIMYYNGTDWVRLAAGTSGQILQANGAAAPSWVAAPSGGILTVTVITTSTTITDVDQLVHLEGTITVTLPASPTAGRKIHLAADVAASSINPNGGTIRSNGSDVTTTETFTAWGSQRITLVYNGSKWIFM